MDVANDLAHGHHVHPLGHEPGHQRPCRLLDQGSHRDRLFNRQVRQVLNVPGGLEDQPTAQEARADGVVEYPSAPFQNGPTGRFHVALEDVAGEAFSRPDDHRRSMTLASRQLPVEAERRIEERAAEAARVVARGGAHDPDHVTLVDETEVGRQLGEIPLTVREAIKCRRDTDPVAVLGQRRARDVAEGSADVEARVAEVVGEVGEIDTGRVRRDGLTGAVDDREMRRLGLPATSDEPSNAWQRADVDALMTAVTDDCVYVTTTGPDPGTTYAGRDEVRRGFAEVLGGDADTTVEFGAPRVVDQMGFIEWSLRGADGRLLARGCDLFEFEGDRIRRKDAFRKVFA